MVISRGALLFALAFSGLVASAADIFSIYGRDDRKDLYAVSNPNVLRAARQVVLLADKENVKPMANHMVALEGQAYGNEFSLCKTERFWNQKLVGFCSGILISPNVVLTAGHCVVKEKDCKDARILFDVSFWEKPLASIIIPQTNVRSCKRIIKRQNSKDGIDYAFIELDEPADRTPSIIGDFSSTEPESVFMVGHPQGMPAKYSGMANVTKSTKMAWITDLDSSHGNSGSPVFDGKSGDFIGLLVAGENGDFVKTNQGCYVSKRCTSKSCYGEVVLKASVIREAADFQ